MGENTNFGVVQPRGSLKEKFKGKEIKDMEVKVLERADAVIESQTGAYLQSVEEDLKRIEAAFADLKNNKADSKSVLAQINEISSRIQTQGISLGYHLLTAVAEELCGVIEKMETAGPTEIQVIRLHMDTMKLIISNRMDGHGGGQGQALLDGLRQTVAKIVPK